MREQGVIASGDEGADAEDGTCPADGGASAPIEADVFAAVLS